MWRYTLFLAAACQFGSTACSRRDEPAPNTQTDRPNAVVSGDAPKSATSEVPALPGPATLAQAIEAIDLRKLPKFEGAKVTYDEPMQIVYTAPGDHAAVAALHRKQLIDLGWKEMPVQGVEVDAKTYTFAVFGRGGFQVALSASQAGEGNGCRVSVANHGNVDVRTLPRLPGHKEKMTQWHYVSYETEAKHDAVMAFHRKELAAKGWKEYRVAGAAFHAKEGRFLHGFRHNGMEVLLNVKENKDGPTVVESSVKVSDRREPTPLDKLPAPATLAEGRTAIDLLRFPRLPDAEFAAGGTADVVYDAPGDVAQAVAFYRKGLADAGWTYVGKTSSENDFLSNLHFMKDGFYLAGTFSKSSKPGRVNVHLENKGNFDVRDTPRPADASEGGHEHPDEIRFDTDSPATNLAAFYAAELGKHGWKEFEKQDYPNGQKVLVLVRNAVALTIDMGDNGVRVRSKLFGVTYPRPATEDRAKRAIDLGKLPRWKMASADFSAPLKVAYSAKGDLAEIAKFVRDELQKRQWAEQPSGKIEAPERVRLRFMKDFFVLDADLLAKEAGMVAVTLENRGDVDTRRLPGPDDARPELPAFEESSRYTTSLTPDAVRAFYRQDLPAIGWKENVELSRGNKTVFEQRSLRLEIDASSRDGRTLVALQTRSALK
jgi:hypothetical protein